MRKRLIHAIDAPLYHMERILPLAIGIAMISQGDFEFKERIGGIEAWYMPLNGLRVLIGPQSIAPVATVNITYLVGSGDEQKGHTGATHYLEHLLFKGTKRFNSASGTDYDYLLDRVGADSSATTNQDRTNYFATLPVKHLELALEIEADRMRDAIIAEEDVETERTVILNELDLALNDPVDNLFQKMWSSVYTKHPYHHPVLGWREDLMQMSRADLKNFYDRFYWPSNATLTVVGAVDTEDVLSLVARHFAPLPAGPASMDRPRIPEPRQKNERRMSIEGPLNMSALIMGYRACKALHDDAPALKMLGRILAFGKNSRLWRKLTDRGLVAHVYAWFQPSRDPGIFNLFAELVPGRSHEEVESVMDETISAIQDGGPTHEEMSLAKAQLAAQEAFSRDGSRGVAWGLSQSIAVGSWQLFTTERERLENVSRDDVRRVARTYLRIEQRTVGLLNPALG